VLVDTSIQNIHVVLRAHAASDRAVAYPVGAMLEEGNETVSAA
jgi:hypothetical protein